MVGMTSSTLAEGLLVYQQEAPQGYYLVKQGSWERLITEDELSTALTAATAPSYGFAKRLTRQLLTAGQGVSFPDSKQFSPDIQPAPADNSFTISRPGVYQVSYSVSGRIEEGLAAECNGVEVASSRIREGETTTRFILNVTQPNSLFVLKSLSRSVVDTASIELIRL